jgi:UDP:flavonoid glycosyltransferase YjiC (YdhE family)
MPATESFEYPRRNLEPQIHFVGPLLPAPPAGFEAPIWWSDLYGARTVHVTQGTVATGPGDLVLPAMEALAGEDVLVVVTGPDLEAVGSVPDNVRLEKYVPHAELLPRVDVMATNAGYNEVLAALAHGVPLVCAGLGEDKANVSARVAWAGAGIDLRTSKPNPEQIRAAVRKVLGDPRYRNNAERIRDDFARHSPGTEAAALLERPAGEKSPIFRQATPKGTRRSSLGGAAVDGFPRKGEDET